MSGLLQGPGGGDHPRLRGKNPVALSDRSGLLGSPPLAREKLDVRCKRKKPVRITPACAGKTPFYLSNEFISRDHPRLRGKNSAFQSFDIAFHGSPPLAREKLAILSLCAIATRITPACAGKTALPPSEARRSQDHPRLRGKNFLSVRAPPLVLGSPPLAREKRDKSKIV